MDRHIVGAVANTTIMAVYAGIAAWRGYHRRRSLMQAKSWAGLTVTLIAGLGLVGLGLAISSGVDRHALWVGAPRSSLRATWTLIAFASLVGGALLSTATLAWFGYGNPSKQFPRISLLHGTQVDASDAVAR